MSVHHSQAGTFAGPIKQGDKAICRRKLNRWHMLSSTKGWHLDQDQDAEGPYEVHMHAIAWKATVWRVGWRGTLAAPAGYDTTDVQPG